MEAELRCGLCDNKIVVQHWDNITSAVELACKTAREEGWKLYPNVAICNKHEKAPFQLFSEEATLT